MKKIPIYLFVLIAVFLSCIPVSAASFQRLSKTTDVLDQWNSQICLYVQGKIMAGDNRSMGEPEFESIGSWIKQNYPHWTVFLIGDATNERFVDAGGNRRSGFDAADFCISTGVYNLSSFQARIDKETGLRNSSIFVICFNPREIRGTSSQLLERYGLNKQMWDGPLSDIAVNRLQNGRRVSAAIQDTIKEVEKRLQQNISNEKAAKEQTVRNATAGVSNAQTSLALLKSEVENFSKQYPKVTGNLVTPNIAQLEAWVASAKDSLNREDFASAENLSRQVVQTYTNHVSALNSYPLASKTLTDLSSEFELLESHEYASEAKDLFKPAQESINIARLAWEKGDSSYVGKVNSAKENVKHLGEIISSAKLKAEAFHAFMVGLEILIALLVVISSFFANRLRRPSMNKALKLFNAWSEALDQKLNGVFILDTRKKEVLGDLRSSVNFIGKTGKLAQEVISKVGNLLIMQVSAKTVLDQAKVLIKPGNPVTAFVNLFCKGNYDKAVTLLQNQPVTFDKKLGLKFVIRGRELSPQEVLWADISQFEEFQLSFNELMDRFNNMAQEATTALDSIDNASINAGKIVNDADARVDQLKALYEEFDLLSTGEGFEVPCALTALIPALDKVTECAKKQFVLDPIAAIENANSVLPSIEAAEKIARLLIGSVRKYRSNLEASFDLLKGQGISPEWIGRGFAEIFERTNDYISKLAKGDAPGSFSLEAEFDKLLKSAEAAVSLAKARIEVVIPDLKDVTSLIDTTRQSIGTQLSLNPNQVLAEKGLNPSGLVEDSQQLLTLTVSLLSSGDVSQAEVSLGQLKLKLAKAREIVNFTIEAVSKHYARVKAIQTASESLTKSVPEHRQLLDSISKRFSPKVLLLGAGDPANPRANGTVEDNLLEVKDAGETRDRLLQEAENLRSTGNIIASVEKLDKAELANEFIKDRLEEIKNKHTRLEKTLAENSGVIFGLEAKQAQIKDAVGDKRVTEKTIATFASSKTRFTTAVNASNSTKPNPFEVADELKTVGHEFTLVEGQIGSDFGQYAEAVRSIGEARNALQQLSSDLGGVTQDDIPDSSFIAGAGGQISPLKSELDTLDKIVKSQVHADWYDVDSRADAIFAKVGMLQSQLRGEVNAGSTAQKAISSASSAVRNAHSWSGSYGVVVYGSPGADSLATAKSKMREGLYEQAARFANKAKQEAESAISSAEAEVSAKRRAEEHQRAQEEAARRERERRISSYDSDSSSSHSSHSGGSSFGGSFHSSSGGSSFSSHMSSGSGGKGW